MSFSLPLEAHGATHSSQHRQHEEQPQASSSLSTALIVHPLSLYSCTLSPTYGQEMFLSKLQLQMQEMQQLYEQQQLQAQQQKLEGVAVATEKKKSLLDYTCDENVKSILGYLDGASLSAAQRVSQYFHQLSGDDAYWYNLCRAEWAISPEQLKTRPASYQALYKYACQSLKRLIRDFFEEQCITSMQQSFRIPRDAALMIARGAR